MGEKSRRNAWLASQPAHIRFRAVMERVSDMLNDVFNHGLSVDQRLTGYALICFPMKNPNGGTHYASNADKLTVAAILEAQAKHLRALTAGGADAPFLAAMAAREAENAGT